MPVVSGKNAGEESMNWLQRNAIGELNWVCYLFGHSFCFIGNYPYIAVCKRCELNNPKAMEVIQPTKEQKI